MEDLQALVILRSLANGVDPESGQNLDPADPIQRPQTIGALVAAVRALERTETMDRKRSLALGKAMVPWTSHEDRQLVAEFDAGKSSRELAALHQRSPKVIRARLARLGRLVRAP